jgi:hypothetical protein
MVTDSYIPCSNLFGKASTAGPEKGLDVGARMECVESTTKTGKTHTVLSTKPITSKRKYRNKVCEFGGEKFDSAKELKRYRDLMILQDIGMIAGLTRQVPFVLAPGVLIAGERRKRPAIRYILDFLYTTGDGSMVHEDVKGMQTPVYRLKKHLMKTVHNIDVKEV